MSEVNITTPEDNATYETRIDQLRREISDLERYVEWVKARIYELENEQLKP